MSYQTICEVCGKVIDNSDGPRWHLDIERAEAWEDVSGELNFCVQCVTDVLYPKITEYMKEHHIESRDAPAEVIEKDDGE